LDFSLFVVFILAFSRGELVTKEIETVIYQSFEEVHRTRVLHFYQYIFTGVGFATGIDYNPMFILSFAQMFDRQICDGSNTKVFYFPLNQFIQK
jgi:hypothetical protein